MLSEVEVYLYVGAFCILFPVVIYSLLTNSQPPPQTWMGKYYAAERYLMLAGNIFLLALLADIAVRLGRHFGWIDTATADTLEPITGAAFFLLLLVFAALWFRAWRKVRATEDQTKL